MYIVVLSSSQLVVIEACDFGHAAASNRVALEQGHYDVATMMRCVCVWVCMCMHVAISAYNYTYMYAWI